MVENLAEKSHRFQDIGFVDQGQAAGVAGGLAAASQIDREIEQARGAAAGKIPLGGPPNLLDRDGTPAEVAHVGTSLCHPHAAYTTGQTIHVNGGGYLN